MRGGCVHDSILTILSVGTVIAIGPSVQWIAATVVPSCAACLCGALPELVAATHGGAGAITLSSKAGDDMFLGGGGGGGKLPRTSRDEMVARARAERAQRAKSRAASEEVAAREAAALKLQRAARRKAAVALHDAKVRADWDNELAGIDKVGHPGRSSATQQPRLSFARSTSELSYCFFAV